jgi:HEAT repeat protein
MLYTLLFATAALAQEPLAKDLIETALKSGNPDTRKLAATALGLGGPRQPFLSLLENLLGDNDVEVRLAALTSLADWKTRDTARLLRKALEDDTPEVSFSAAKALYAIHDPAGKTALLAILSGENRTSSGFLTKQKRDALRMFHTPKAAIWLGVKSGLGFVPVPGLGEGIASVQALTSDPGFSGRAMAALLIGKDRDVATTFALREALMDSEWSVRAAAVHSVALRNDPAALRDLKPLLADKNQNVRLRAAAAVLRLEQVKGR